LAESFAVAEQVGIASSGAAVGCQDEHDAMTGINRPGDGAGTDEGFIIGMGMEEHDRAGRHPPIVSGAFCGGREVP
jgi:hypothetical protein